MTGMEHDATPITFYIELSSNDPPYEIAGI